MKSLPGIAGLLLASAAVAIGVEPQTMRSEIVGGTGLVKVEHSPFGWEASATKKVPLLVCGRVWKPVNGALVVIGYLPIPIHTKLVSWQDAQLLLTPL